MGCIKFIHFADLHIGRSLSFLRAHDDYELYGKILSFVSELADKYDISFFVLPGDIFNSTIIDYKFKFLFTRFLKKNNNRRIYFLSGNHDSYEREFYDFFKYYDNFIIFNNNEIKFYDEGDISVAGVNLDYSLKNVNPLKKCDRGVFRKPTVFLMHSNFIGLVGDHENYLPIGVDDLKKFNVPVYLAMGHIHQYYFKIINNVTVAYPGSPIPVRINEIGNKYLNLVEFDGKNFSVSKINTGIMIYEKELVVKECDKLENVYDKLARVISDQFYYFIKIRGVARGKLKWELIEAKKDLMDEFPNIVDMLDESLTDFELKEIDKMGIFQKLLYEESLKEMEIFDENLKKLIKKYDISLDYNKLKKNALSYLFANIVNDE
ncbi:metallophosphoesterase family protein [Deferribacter abyssi]|uniref:metallophosphoesterase family protein n=1 Tax=Deferribacter abyssi TaxID=213806 RepID=UPI003C1C0695